MACPRKSSIFALVNRIALLIYLMLLSVSVAAQRRLVVCDVETLEPISSVSVQSSVGVDTTDSLGYFSVPDTCKSILLSHVNYESRLLHLNEVHDTVFLVSKYLGIREVVVFGKGKDNVIVGIVVLQSYLAEHISLHSLEVDHSAGDRLNAPRLVDVLHKLSDTALVVKGL